MDPLIQCECLRTGDTTLPESRHPLLSFCSLLPAFPLLERNMSSCLQCCAEETPGSVAHWLWHWSVNHLGWISLSPPEEEADLFMPFIFCFLFQAFQWKCSSCGLWKVRVNWYVNSILLSGLISNWIWSADVKDCFITDNLCLFFRHLVRFIC